MASSVSWYGRASAFLLFALLFNSRAGAAAANVDPLLPTCKSVDGGSTYFDIDFCMSALGSADDLNSHASEDPNLRILPSIIAVDFLTANATNTAAKIRGLVVAAGGGGDAATRRCLLLCQALYRGILQQQPACAAAIKGGRFAEASASVETSAKAARWCEEGFSANKVASPLTAENDNVSNLAKLAEALLSYLL